MSQGLRSHPAARRPVLAALVLLGLGVLGGAAWAVLPEPAVILSLGLVLGVRLLPFYAPTDYLFDEEGLEVVRAGRRWRYPWTRFAGFQVQRDGILLLPVAAGARRGGRTRARAPGPGGSPAAPGRGPHRREVFLPLDADLQARARPLLEARLPQR